MTVPHRLNPHIFAKSIISFRDFVFSTMLLFRALGFPVLYQNAMPVSKLVIFVLPPIFFKVIGHYTVRSTPIKTIEL